MESQLMKVPDDHLIPMQYPYEHSEIYIRECFPRYFELLWEDLFVKKKRFVLITGTPGIGKSIFYIYVMQRMKERLPGDVVLVLASFSKISELKSCVILKPGKSPVKLKAGKNLPIFEKAVYLLDGIPRIVFDESIHVKTVIFASPNHQFLKEHSKNALMSNLYMPLWTEPEILEAVELLELELDEKLVRDLFYRFGGSVRYILTEDQDFRDEGMDSQIKAITSINSYAILEKCLQLKLEDKDVIHRVFYFVPRADSPRKYEMNLGSIYIKYAVEENLENADKQERLNLFRWLNSHGHSKSTAGWLFEGYCHDFLSSGFEGSAKSLIDDATYLDLKILEGYQRVATIKSIEEIYRNMYSVPESSNLPAVDSFYIDQQKRMIYFVPDDLPSDIANQFPKQKISGGVDDLKNSDVQQIRGIGKESAKQLKSLKIFTMHDLFVAIQDELILKKMQNFIKSAYISEFRASVEQIQKYEVLSAIPQYILAIKVEKK